MRPTDAEITRHQHGDRPDSDAWVDGHVQTPYHFTTAEYEVRWPADFDHVAGAIRDALGERVLELHHVGSTSVVGLPAKPVIDVDLVVADPVAYVHIFGPDCPEVIRHLMFHDWLVEHPEERERYAAAKRAAAAGMNARPGGGTGMDYNRRKGPLVRAIYDRMFRAHGMLP